MKEKDEIKRNKILFEMRRDIRIFGNAGKRTANLSDLVKLNQLGREEIRKQRKDFSAYEKLIAGGGD